MGSSYKDIDAKCPFYLSLEDSNKWASICCEGIDDGEETRLKLQFSKRADRDLYKTIRCDSCFDECTICKMLVQKYE